MINRTTNLIGDAHDLKITTFHSFWKDFLQENLLKIKLGANYKTITETAQLVFFEKNVNTFGLEYIDFSENSSILAEEAKNFILRYEDEFISIGDLQQHVNQKDLKKIVYIL
jgi:superfamily I DNA/RNA helicase